MAFQRSGRNYVLLALILLTLIVLLPLLHVEKESYWKPIKSFFTVSQYRPSERVNTLYPLKLPTTDDFLHFHFGVGNMSSTEDRLLNFIRNQIASPSPNRPRTLSEPTRAHFSQLGESEYLDTHMKQKRKGFFVEAGALDGETYSNSLFFERERNWTGLLIEANPFLYRSILEKNRNAFVLGACISPNPFPSTLKFVPSNAMGGLVDKMPAARYAFINGAATGHVMVMCFPFNSIMAALNVSHIDLFSLDVEGPEVEILETIDFNKLRIDIMIIENGDGAGWNATALKLEKIRKLVSNTKLYKEVAVHQAIDVIFERLDLKY